MYPFLLVKLNLGRNAIEMQRSENTEHNKQINNNLTSFQVVFVEGNTLTSYQLQFKIHKTNPPKMQDDDDELACFLSF